MQLRPDEVKHIRSRRLQSGQEIYLGDGRGNRYLGYLDSNYTVVRIQFIENRIEAIRVLHVAVAKGQRWDSLLEKATELGVTEIQPVLFERSVRTSVSYQRSLRMIEQASAQSRRYRLPQLQQILDFKNWMDLYSSCHTLFFLDNTVPNSSSLLQAATQSNLTDRVDFLIGPEGGFSESEKKELIARFPCLSAGPSVLRIETAAIAALACFREPA